MVASVPLLDSEGSGPGASSLIPGPILLLGAPGSGKGTQAQAIMSSWKIPQISTGDLLRDNMARGTELGIAAKRWMAEGKLVSDDLVNQMVAARLAQQDTGRGYLLDGYPRTLKQAEWLDARLQTGSSNGPVVAVSIEVSYTQLLCRVTGRRTCPTCQRIYNVYLRPPKADMICDVDGTSLVARADDVEAVFEERMRVYRAQTAPVVEHYRVQGRFVEVDGEQPVETVAAAIMTAVIDLRRRT